MIAVDHVRVAHPGDAALGADVGGHALERHHGDGAGVLGDLGLLGGDDVHDHAALEHLGHPALDAGGAGARWGCLVCSSRCDLLGLRWRARWARPRGAGMSQPTSRRGPAQPDQRDEAGRGHVVEVDRAQLGGLPRQPQPADPAAGAQRPGGDHHVVVEPAGQLDLAQSRASSSSERRDRRRPGAARARPRGRRTPPAAPRDSADSADSNSSGPALRARWAASSSSSRLAGSSTSEEASSRVAPDRRSSWVSRVARATSMRWCIRSSRLRGPGQPQPDHATHQDAAPSTRPPGRSRRLPPTTVS